nr:hypothetical protein [uncultured Mucilaginibacter sp.]
MKTLLITFLFVASGFFEGFCDEVPSSSKFINLKYDFKKNVPIALKVARSGDLFVGDGQSIYRFNSSGAFMAKSNVGAIISRDLHYIDFYVDNEDENLIYVAAFKKLIGFNFKTKQKTFEASFPGSSINFANSKFYTQYQQYDEKNNIVLNKIWVMDMTGKGWPYASKVDFSGENFQIVNTDLFILNADSTLYKISTITSSLTRIAKIKLPYDSPVIFLGSLQRKYLYKIHDYKLKIDYIYVFDEHFRFLKKEAVPLAYRDISKSFREYENGDWLADYPSGNIYTYNGSDIYLMRSTIKGTFIYKLSEMIK